MIKLDNMEQFNKAYHRWLELDTNKFWAIGTQDFPYRHVHVPLFDNITCTEENGMPTMHMPVPATYPIGKIRAGLVCPKHSVWVIYRNFDMTVQEFLMNYLKATHGLTEPVLSKGPSHNQNDVMINGKKVLGQIQVVRAGQTYYGCFFNITMDEQDKKDLADGMKDDRNFYADKVASISGIKDEVPDFDENKFLGELEAFFMQSGVPEYKKFEVM